MRKLVWQNSLGDEINLTKAPYGIINWEGFSNAPLNIQSQQVPMQDGSVFLDALIENRDLNVTLSIQDGNDLEKRYELERQLIHILNPKLGEGYLIYTNDFISKRIKCVPQIPLFPNKNSNDPGTQKGELSWTACEPYWEDTYLSYGTLEQGDVFVIENKGDIPASLDLDFYCSNVKNAEILNISTNKKIAIEKQVTGTVSVSTEVGNKNVFLQGEEITLKEFGLTYYKILYNEKLSIFLGMDNYANIISISYNGLNWQNIILEKLGESETVNDCCVYEDYFYLFGSAGTNLRSKDCFNWEVLDMSEIVDSSLANENIIVITTKSKKILTSSDHGENWEVVYQGSDYLGRVYFVNSQWVIKTQLQQKYLLSNNLSEWNEITLFSNLSNFIYTDKYYATNGNTLYSSENLLSEDVWTTEYQATENIRYFIFSDYYNAFILELVHKIMFKRNGIQWVELQLPEIEVNDYGLLSITTFRKKIIIGSDRGILLFSNNAVSFSYTDRYVKNALFSVNYANGVSISVGAHNRIVYKEKDKNWESVNYAVTNDYLLCTIFAKNEYISAGQNNLLMKSSNGKAWQSYATNLDVILKIIYVEEHDIYFCLGGNIRNENVMATLYQSHDLLNWESVLGIYVTYPISTQFLSDPKVDVKQAKGDDVLVVFGTGIYNIRQWYVDTPFFQLLKNFSSDMYCVSYNESESCYICAGENQLYTSYDLANWTLQPVSIQNARNMFYHENATYLITDKKILKTYNCEVWETVFNSAITIRDITFDYEENCFYIVGYYGLILQIKMIDLESLIQYISKDSDMSMNLRVGKNELRISAGNSEFNVLLKYRQKYIGV